MSILNPNLSQTSEVAEKNQEVLNGFFEMATKNFDRKITNDIEKQLGICSVEVEVAIMLTDPGTKLVRARIYKEYDLWKWRGGNETLRITMGDCIRKVLEKCQNVGYRIGLKDVINVNILRGGNNATGPDFVHLYPQTINPDILMKHCGDDKYSLDLESGGLLL